MLASSLPFTCLVLAVYQCDLAAPMPVNSLYVSRLSAMFRITASNRD